MTIANIAETANLLVKPTARLGSSHPHCVLGDAHGNALYMLYFLIHEGFVRNISTANYRKFSDCYLNCNRDTVMDGAALINALKINPGRLTFLGDMMADRGMCDYYNLLLLKKLHEAKCQFKITLSNHDAVFLYAYLVDFDTQAAQLYQLDHLQERSLDNLISFIYNGIIDKEEIMQLVKQDYLPHLVLFDYAYDLAQDTLVIFSHAPVGLEALAAFINFFQISAPAFDNLDNICLCIDLVNDAFYQTLTEPQNFIEMIHLSNMIIPTTQLQQNPFGYITWNRRYTTLLRPTHPLSNTHQSLYYCHGHDCNDIPATHIYCLDGLLGKFNKTSGEYCILQV